MSERKFLLVFVLIAAVATGIVIAWKFTNRTNLLEDVWVQRVDIPPMGSFDRMIGTEALEIGKNGNWIEQMKYEDGRVVTRRGTWRLQDDKLWLYPTAPFTSNDEVDHAPTVYEYILTERYLYLTEQAVQGSHLDLLRKFFEKQMAEASNKDFWKGLIESSKQSTQQQYTRLKYDSSFPADFRLIK